MILRIRSAAGFSLLELMVAVAVLSIALVGVMQTLAQGMSTARIAAEQTQSIELAEQKLSELLLNPDLAPGDDEGDFGDDYPRYRWSATIESTELDELLRLVVTVTWTSGANERSVDVETCYAPNAVTEDLGSTDAAGQAVESADTSDPTAPEAAALGGALDGALGGVQPSR